MGEREIGKFPANYLVVVHGDAATESAAAERLPQITDEPIAELVHLVTDHSEDPERIRDQIAAQLPDGGVALQLAFVVGSRRAWPDLWKATIDSLGFLLGRDAGAGQWNVRDGRMTDLGPHCVVDSNARSRVVVAMRAGAVTSPAWPETSAAAWATTPRMGMVRR